MEKDYSEGLAAVRQRLGADLDAGLTQQQARERLDQYGKNQLREAEGEPAWKKFLAQFKGLIIGLLLVAAILSGLLGEWIDTIAILAIVLLNALLGFFQEARAEKALAALRRMAAPQAKVRRSGVTHIMPAYDIVPGDLVELEAGDHVPADARLIAAFGLQCQEASLTGESTPVLKEWKVVVPVGTPLGDRRNMVFAGTMVVAGKGRAVVTSTAMNTEIGAIAGLLQQAELTQTPMQRRLEELGKVLVTACLVIVAVIFAIQILRGGKLVDTFLTSVSLAVAAVPEGLPAVVTVTLAIGLQRMATRNALIRNLPSVETLGCVDVICSDKTGTLTRNEMTVRRFWTSGHRWHVTGEGFSSDGKITWIDPDCASSGRSKNSLPDQDQQDSLYQDLVWLNQVALSCNNASWRWNAQSRQATSVGDPTEVALLVAAAKLESVEYVQHLVPVYEVPFDSERKMMSQVFQWPDGQFYMFAKGASEVILERCGKIRMLGEDRSMKAADRAAIEDENNQLTHQALRVLGLAYRTVKADGSDWSVEQDFTFVGLVGMIDPPRTEVAAAVARCKNAGIRPVMITGDHPQTALAIGRALKFVDGEESVMSGTELDSIADEQLRQSVDRVSIFARVSAQHKLRIVDAFRANGHVVAMTGDGVNDAPAVKKADIGIVMGITGTDVAKEAADMVLTDDNFASIVNAVEEGRGIYENIQKFLHFLLACNFSEVLFMFIAALIGWASPLLPIQILWINLVTDGIPALALAMEPIEKHLMSRSPRSLSEPVLPTWRIILIAWHGGMMAATAVFAYAWMLSFPNVLPVEATTIAFCTITLSQVFFSVGCRSFSKTMPQIGLFTNPTLVIAVLATVMIQAAVVSIPWTAKILQVQPVRIEQWPWIIGLSLVPVTIVEVAKLIYLGLLRRPLDATK